MVDFQYNSDMAIHPGKTLDDLLGSLNMPQVDLAKRLELTPKFINEIIQGKSSITPETAIKLSSVFGMSSSFWNNLQKKFDETKARIKAKEFFQKEISYLKDFFCYQELAKWNYVKKTTDKIEKVHNLLNFFGVSSLSLIPEIQSVAFRCSKFKNLSKESLAAWLRCGEIAAQRIKTDSFNKEKLINSLLELRSLTTEDPEDFSAKLEKICSSSGVAVVFIPYFRRTFVNGMTKWLNQDKALIQLSLRTKYTDVFWFTFFHEIAHILKHGKKEQFVEIDKNDTNLDKEKEADEFACNFLISKEDFNVFNRKGDFSHKAIIQFANQINIHPSIVAGRLARNYKSWNKFSYLRTQIKFIGDN